MSASFAVSRPSAIVDGFRRILRDSPNRPLIHLPLSGAAVTAEVIWEAAIAQQRALLAAEIGAGSVVLYTAGNRPELLALWLAMRATGAVLMPVDAGTTAAEIDSLASRFGAAAIVSPAAADADAALLAPGLAIARLPPDAAHAADADAAVYKLTSGSTGLPRATSTSESHIVEDTDHIVTAMGIAPDDVQMAVIPLSHAYGIGNLVMPLLLRGTAIVLRETFVPGRFVADAAAWGATVFPGVPFMFDHFNAHLQPGAWPSGLATLMSAGARLEPATTRAFHSSFGVKIHSFYGTSETGGIAYDDSPALADEPTVGRAMPGVTISLLEEDGAPAGAGRVHVASTAVSSGYAGGEAFDSGGLGSGFLTGDYGRFDGSGQLSLVGRVSSFINVAGRKVQPDEIETVLREMPGVADVRIVGAPDATRGQQIVACIVPASGEVTPLAVRQFTSRRLATYKVPRAVLLLEQIPRTARGKTDRRELEAIVAAWLRGTSSTGVL